MSWSTADTTRVWTPKSTSTTAKRKRLQQATPAEDLESTRRITDYFHPISSGHGTNDSGSGRETDSAQDTSATYRKRSLQQELDQEPGPSPPQQPHNPHALVLLGQTQDSIPPINGDHHQEYRLCLTPSQHQVHPEEVERLSEKLREAEDTISRFRRDFDHLRSERESRQRYTDTLQVRLVESLKIACEKARSDFQDSLFHRRRTIGRIVLADTTSFDRTKEELWQDGEEFDRVRKELESIEQEIKLLEHACLDIKRVRSAAVEANLTNPRLPNVSSNGSGKISGESTASGATGAGAGTENTDPTSRFPPCINSMYYTDRPLKSSNTSSRSNSSNNSNNNNSSSSSGSSSSSQSDDSKQNNSSTTSSSSSSSSSSTLSPSLYAMTEDEEQHQPSQSQQKPTIPLPSPAIPEILRYYEIASTTLPLPQLYQILQFRIGKCKAEKKRLLLELESLEAQKKRLIRDERLLVDSLASQFQHCPLVDGRYQLLQMLGKGGFSEVYRAFDLKELRYVACKIQVIQSSWVRETKETYIKYVERECMIHNTLKHPHIVRFYRVVGLSPHILMFVLEECDGGDLDSYLKIKGTLQENEAASIMIQILHALIALKSTDASKTKEVIHYDLKPGNILFHRGVVKISDFGLSKAKDKGIASIDQTSIGAGTAGYLPPECFSKGSKITEKVDIWSCGVIMYQMLTGQLPFRDRDMCENDVKQKLDAQKTISHECRDFILKCLTTDPNYRISAERALQLPFFMKWFGSPDDTTFSLPSPGHNKAA